MAGQIVNVSNNEAISEVALKCGDPFFKDFPRNIYSQGVYRAQRSIAKRFGVLDRVWSYTNTPGTSPIEIVPLNFNGDWKLDVTVVDGDPVEYTKVKLEEVLESDNTSDVLYHVFFNANKYYIYYTNPAVDDVITLYYTSLIAGEEDYEPYDSEGNEIAVPVLPNKYFEEVVRQAVRYIAQLGVATFEADKAQKYTRILQLYTQREDQVQERHLEKSRPWIEMTPFQYP